MKYILFCLTSILLFSACQKNKLPIYQGNNFTIYNNEVKQGPFSVQVLSPNHMTSDYQSPTNVTFPNLIEFKFAINGKDNEMPIGVNHTFLLKPNADNGIVLPVITFGTAHTRETTTTPPGSIEPNTTLTIKVDASEIMEAFNTKGYYKTHNGETIYKEDFNGIYVVGNLAPLTWDFDNLSGRSDRQLKDENEDGIFELTLLLNPHNTNHYTANEWKLKNDISHYPQLSSSVPLIDALYRLALDETIMNIEDDGTFRTGEEWPGVWTRDVSYSILLAYAYTDTEVAKTSLMRKVKNDRIIQDTGTGGAWPISTDRTTWAIAAWEIYKVTGDQEWLKTIYPIIKNSVNDDLQTLKDTRSQLIKGESSFLDWRKQTYPFWMNGVDIFESRCLGTNAVHARTYEILAKMAQLLNEEYQIYQDESQLVSNAINNELWLEDKGYYAQFLYGRNKLILSPRSEALGEALTILFNIADTLQTTRIIENTPVLDYGIPCIHPQIPDIPPYHNNGIWPFVQAYWNWACAKSGHSQALEQGIAGLYRSAALFLTNKENMVAENGDFRDTEVNSNRQLWSVAGNLSTIYRVFLGLNFELDGIHLSPFIPEIFGRALTLKNFSYRGATLDFTIKGNGSTIKSFTLDGIQQSEPFIDKDITGHHRITIELTGSKEPDQKKKIVKNTFSLKTPAIKVNRNKLNWNDVEGAKAYQIIRNGEKILTTANTEYIVEVNGAYQEISIIATNNNTQSFASEPIAFLPANTITIQLGNSQAENNTKVNGYRGDGFITLSHTENVKLSSEITAPHTGRYLIQARYSNGSGPENTDNKCAIRTLFVNNEKAGVIVMPQRGIDEWSNWGYTNLIEVELLKGKNKLMLSFERYNTNMNGEINHALLDEFRIIPLN